MTRFACIALLLLLLLMSAPETTVPAAAQGPATAWGAPLLVSRSDGAIHTPAIVADRTGLAHIFWTVAGTSDGRATDGSTVYYAQCCDQGGPRVVDIFSTPAFQMPRVALDANGALHLLMSFDGRLYYTFAPVAAAATSRGWERPTVLDDSTPNGDIVADSDGNLHAAYARFGAAGPYLRTSKDGGRTWTAPQNIGPTSSDEAMADFVRLAVGTDGALHAVWTELRLPLGWPPVGVYYARSTDGGRSWSSPLRLAADGYDQINVTTVDAATVHVVWNSFAGGRGRFHRTSTDGGRTWSGTVEMYPAAGTTGVPGLAVDAAGVLHFLSSEGGPQGPLYTTWVGGAWSPVAPIGGSRPQFSDYMEEAVLAVSQGNRLHAAYWDNRQTLWYQTRQTDAPGTSGAPYPTSTPVTLPTQVPAPTVVASTPGIRRVVAAPPGDRRNLEAEAGSARTTAFIAGALPALALVLGALGIHYTRTRRR